MLAVQRLVDYQGVVAAMKVLPGDAECACRWVISYACSQMEMDHLVALAQRRCVWMHWPNNCTDTDYHCTIVPPVSEMGFIHTVI